MVTCEKMLCGLRVTGTMAMGGRVRCKASTSSRGEVLHGAFAPALSFPLQHFFPPLALRGQRGSIACLPH